ncbi:MAG TPA: 30S ribosome-binding factor RbfA [Bacteroidota bacterium]|nr:30S ribosome-binding factor RbfA [Bacteroidota bacterium]
MSVRTERVASLLRHELGTIISREYSGGELGFSTVTEVRVTPDLKIAKIYVSILGSPEVRTKTLARLESEKAQLRSTLAAHINMRFTPALQFYQDDTMDRVENLERLIKKIHENDGDAH